MEDEYRIQSNQQNQNQVQVPIAMNKQFDG